MIGVNSLFAAKELSRHENSTRTMHDVQEEEVNEALKLSFLSSCLLFAGCSCLGASVIIRRKDYFFGEDRSGSEGLWNYSDTLIPQILVLVGFAFVFLHTVPEIRIDRPPLRPFTHGRYARTRFQSDKINRIDYCALNRAQSVMFGVAGMLEFAGYLILFDGILRKGDQLRFIGIFRSFNLAAAFLWLLTAALVLVTRGCCWFRCCQTFRDTCDQVGNGIFIVSTVVWMFAALTQFEDFDETFLEGLLQDMCMLSWTVMSTFYLAADLQRFSCYRPTPPKKISNVDHSPLTTITSNGTMYQESKLKKYKNKSTATTTTTAGAPSAGSISNEKGSGMTTEQNDGGRNGYFKGIAFVKGAKDGSKTELPLRKSRTYQV